MTNPEVSKYITFGALKYQILSLQAKAVANLDACISKVHVLL